MIRKLTIVLLSLLGLMATQAAELDIHYKGYVGLFGGYAVPQREIKGAPLYGISTTHGATIVDGLFMGAGLNVGISPYRVRYDNHLEESHKSNAVLTAVYAEVKYNIMSDKRISPFLACRVGPEYNGFDKNIGLYANPYVGCTFFFTDRFGLDVGVGYEYYGGKPENDIHNGSYTKDQTFGNVNCITFSMGIIF